MTDHFSLGQDMVMYKTRCRCLGSRIKKYKNTRTPLKKPPKKHNRSTLLVWMFSLPRIRLWCTALAEHAEEDELPGWQGPMM